jgi:DNA-binding NarL/FixJ family response regulator
MKTCLNCIKRCDCTQLCIKAETYVSKDEVHMTPKEIPMGILRYGQFPEQIRAIHLTFIERQILTLWNQGLERETISKTLNISKPSLRVHLSNIRKKLS